MSEQVPPSWSPALQKVLRSLVAWWPLVLGGLILMAVGVLYVNRNPFGCTLRVSHSLNTACALETAVINFRREYGRLPDPRFSKTQGDATIATTGEEGQRLLAILTGRETGPTHQNPQGLNFFPCREGKEAKNGLIELPSRACELRDSSGDPYYLRIDFDQNEELKVPGNHLGTETIRGRCVAVYTLANDVKNAVRTW